jgi:hypothetical protein
MKISIEKIRNINTVIVFMLLLIGIVYSIVQGVLFIINSFPHNSSQEIQIIPSESKTTITQETRYNTLLRDVFVFSVESNSVREVANDKFEKSVASNNRSSNNEIVNFQFISEKQKQEQQLLPNNSLIISYQFINDEKLNGFLLSKNVYAIAEKDSDNNKKLSSDDVIDLYVSDYNGKNLKIIGQNIYGYQVVKNNTVLFTEVMDNKQIIKIYSTENNDVQEIKRINSKPDNKDFNHVFY